MRLTTRALLLALTALLATALAGCETTADPELRRAEKAINEALASGADASATEDYTAAEELLMKAQELARNNRILEARSTAIEAKLRANDAKIKADERLKILEAEAEQLGK